MPEVELSAGTIEYQDTGGEGPPIVLLHGLLMDATLWEEVVGELSPDYRCIAPTLPLGAHRQAMRGDADLSLPGIARLLVERLDCTTSRSSATTPAAARPAPGRRRGRRHRADRARLLRGVRQLPSRCHRQDASADRQARAQPLRPVHAADAVPSAQTDASRLRLADEARRRHHRPLDSACPEAAGDPPRQRARPPRDRRATGPQTAERLAGYGAPALVVWASQDRVMRLEHGHRLAELLPQGRLVEIPDSYTLIPLDQPIALAKAIREFVR